MYEKAARQRGVTGEQMLQILETRLDNVVYQLGFASTRAAARQMVAHGHLQVNGRKVSIPSFALKVNDVIEVKNTNVSRQLATKNLEIVHQPRGAGLAVAGARTSSRASSCGFPRATRSSPSPTNRPSSNFIPANPVPPCGGSYEQLYGPLPRRERSAAARLKLHHKNICQFD